MSGNLPPQLTVSSNGVGVVPDALLNTFVIGACTITQLRSFTGIGAMTVIAVGSSTPGDGGGGTYYWSGSATGADNGTTVIAPNGVSVGRWLIFAPPYTGPVTGLITQASTGFFYTSQGAYIDRLNDRLLVGAAATVQDGNAGPTNKSWLAAAAGGEDLYMDTLSTFESIAAPGSAYGGIGGAFAARTSDAGSAANSFGITTYGQNDGTGASEAWGMYATAVSLVSNAYYTVGVESDVTTTQTSVVPNAYNPLPAGFTGCFSAAAGGETALAASGLTVNPTSAGITLFSAGTGVNTANPKAGTGAIFEKGIVFDSQVISGADGFTAGAWGTAIEMAQGHAIVWRTNDGSTTRTGAMIRSDVLGTEEAHGSRIVFNGALGTFQIKGVLSDLVTEFVAAAVSVIPGIGSGTPVNNLALFANTTGAPPQLGAVGSDTNIDLQLLTKGSGVVWMGATAGSASVAGNFSAAHYIKVKDGAGTVYYVPCATATW